jgi:tetratricopeptide (TPR) repeat protein
MNRIIFLILISFGFPDLKAQIPSLLYPKVIDSLFKQLSSCEGKEKVDALNGLALYLAPRYYDSSLSEAMKALQLAEKLNYEKGKGVAIFNAGNSYYFRLDAKRALAYYLDALRVMENLEPSQELGNLYFQIGCFTDVPGSFRKAMLVFKCAGNRASEDFVRMKLLSRRGDMTYDSIIILGKRELQYFRKSGNRFGIYTTLMAITNACFYTRRPEGLAYAEEALALAESTGDEWLIANALHKVANYHKNIFKFPEYTTRGKLAESMLVRCKDILLRSTLPYRNHLLSETYRELGELCFDAGKYKEAIPLINMAVATVDTFLSGFDTILYPEPDFKYNAYVSDLMNMRISFSDLRNTYTRIGNYRMANEEGLRFDSITEIIQQNYSDSQLSVTQLKYEDENKRNRIELLKKENELQQVRQSHALTTYSLVGGAVLIVLLVILVFQQRKRFQSEHKALVLEQKLLRSQMNPHFLFNALTGIQNFIVAQKPDKASIYLSKFANLVRNILDNSVEEFVTLEKEISTIENYLELQKVRYTGKFDYRIQVAETIDIETIMIPPMLAQPFIENSIEHGIKHRDTPGHIDIRFNNRDNTLIFEVEDDGVGRQKAREIDLQREPGHRSMATSLTRDRLANLNRKRRKKIILEIIDLENAYGEATGTKVIFGIPLKQ